MVPLARQVLRRFRQMIGDAFDRAMDALIVDAMHSRAVEQRDIVHVAERRDGLRHPFGGGRFADRRQAVAQAAAEAGMLLGEDDPRAGAGRAEGRHQAGRTAASDQHIAFVIAVLVAFGVRLEAALAHARGAPDDRLVPHP